MSAERTAGDFGTQLARGARAPRHLAAPDRQRHQDLGQRARSARAQRHLAAAGRHLQPRLRPLVRDRGRARSGRDDPGLHRAVPERLGDGRPSDVRRRSRTTRRSRATAGWRRRSSADRCSACRSSGVCCTSATVGRPRAPSRRNRRPRRHAPRRAGGAGRPPRSPSRRRSCPRRRPSRLARRRRLAPPRRRRRAPRLAADGRAVGEAPLLGVGDRRRAAARSQRLLQAGEEQTLRRCSSELVLTAGDAAAIALKLNGADARPLGKAGEVVTARFTLDNFKDYLLRR